MLARAALAAALFALASPAPSQPPKKKDKPAAKADPAKVAAAEKALFAMKCTLTREDDKTKSTFRETKQVTFPETATDADFGKAVPHLLALPALTALDIGGTKITDAGAADIAKFPNLDALFLDSPALTAKTLEVAANLPNVRWLVLAGNMGKGLPVGKPEVAAIAKFPRLNHLALTLLRPVGGADVEPLKELTGLRELTVYGGSRLGPDGLRHLTASRSLTSLSLLGAWNPPPGGGKAYEECEIGDPEAKVLAEATGLTQLSFPSDYFRLTDAGVKSLSDLRALTSLWVAGKAITLGKASGIGEMKALRSLRVTAPVGEEGLAQITDLPELVDLTLYLSGGTIGGPADFSRLKKLTRLTLSGRVGDDGVGKIAQLSALTKLDLMLEGESFGEAANFAGLKKLTTVGVGGPLTDAGLKALATLPAVADLTLTETAVTDAGLKAIPKLRSLKRLTLDNNSTSFRRGRTAAVGTLTGGGLKYLAGSGITELHIWSPHATSQARDRAAHAFPIGKDDLKGLSGCKALTELHLTYSPADDTTIKPLAGVRTLKNVYAVGTGVTKVGKAAVERAVPGCVVHIEFRGGGGSDVRSARDVGTGSPRKP